MRILCGCTFVKGGTRLEGSAGAIFPRRRASSHPMTAEELYRSFQESIATLRELRAKTELPDLDLEDGPEMRMDARRFAAHLELAADAQAAEAALQADRAGAQAFWHLVKTRWETMETFLMPSAFELKPDPLPFEALCRCEWWLEEMADTPPAAAEPTALTPSAIEEPAELEWEQATHAGELPGLPRPVRAAFEAPELELNAMEASDLEPEPERPGVKISLAEPV